MIIKNNMPIIGDGGLSIEAGVGGAGFAPGPADNIFGAAGSSSDNDILQVTVAASRSIAEETRDAYAEANQGPPTWLSGYTNNLVSIQLYYMEGGDRFIQYQRRVGTSWVNIGDPVVALKGDPGTPGAATDFSGIGGVNRVLASGAAPGHDPVDSGLRAENGILYFGEIDNQFTMRIRRRASDGFLFFERYNGTSWVEVFQMSNSATVDIVHFTESTGPPTVPAGELCLYNQTIRDDQGNEILRPFLSDGTNIYPAMASLADGSVRVIQNLSDIMANPGTVNAQYKTITFNEDLATVAKSGSYNDLSDRPTIPATRTDEEIRDVIGLALRAGPNVTITIDDAANTITIAATGGTGGGTNPPTDADRIYYGLSSSNNPATVDVSTLTRDDTPTNPDMVATGPAAQGNYFILLVPQDDDIINIFDTVLNQDVTDIFEETDNVRVIDTITFKSYVLGPLNAGVNETYVINFGS